MKAYYKTKSGKIVELGDLTEQNLWNKNITELILNENCQEVYCWDNQLKEFDTNKAQYVGCDMKSLTNLNKVDRLNLLI